MLQSTFRNDLPSHLKLSRTRPMFFFTSRRLWFFLFPTNFPHLRSQPDTQFNERLAMKFLAPHSRKHFIVKTLSPASVLGYTSMSINYSNFTLSLNNFTIFVFSYSCLNSFAHEPLVSRIHQFIRKNFNIIIKDSTFLRLTENVYIMITGLTAVIIIISIT